ncbi:MAG: hypothetical protein C7B43_17465 [Sulfobacillus benefaciens]|uniref:Uncharacterized protein n=1 Tax=Sulfobacillus benefaciens TaxID=453960 RepID=A0A2T2WSG7_9FIRM|nr:MAG: hypothetical protein C7B43_17465 [Sulfobacillus benefaciens]HBQ96430.1 hypothetical protein [Sulfobacillus sp.]
MGFCVSVKVLETWRGKPADLGTVFVWASGGTLIGYALGSHKENILPGLRREGQPSTNMGWLGGWHLICGSEVVNLMAGAIPLDDEKYL